MAAKLDVAGRLAEARPAVDNTQCYVWACHQLDYQNPDLTLHPAQIRDWFSSEDGMDLRVLDADCSALQAAAAAADDALRRQRDQLAALTAAWRGSGARSAEDFVRRHCETAGEVVASMHTAAEGLTALRDTLWQIVDTKADAATAIDDRRQAERPAWLAAAQTVTAGVGDRATASELVDLQVKPYVDNDIRVDWLTAMRTAITSIGKAYDVATGGLTSAPPAQFEVPGDFGPAPSPRDDDAPPPREPASTPAASAAPAPPPPPAPVPSYPAPPDPAPPTSSMPAPAPMSMPTGAGVPAAAPAAAPTMPAAPVGQLDGLPQRFADTLSGLLPSLGDSALPDPPSDETTEHETPEDEEQDADATTATDEAEGEECSGSGQLDEPAEPPPPAEPLPEQPPPQPTPTPEPPPPPPEPLPPPPLPVDEAATPCEIAAEELPQAGE